MTTTPDTETRVIVDLMLALKTLIDLCDLAEQADSHWLSAANVRRIASGALFNAQENAPPTPAAPIEPSAELRNDYVPADEPDKVRNALQYLYDDCADYMRINNMHAALNNWAMQRARAALATPPEPAQDREDALRLDVPPPLIAKATWIES